MMLAAAQTDNAEIRKRRRAGAADRVMRILLSAMHDGRCETARAASVSVDFPDCIGARIRVTVFQRMRCVKPAPRSRPRVGLQTREPDERLIARAAAHFRLRL
ncbi:hypothetical protein PCAR4_470047 [Paraburkholderia caribensis]|nr:hypothetical protein PCAR4_470047 [Paraburkholderia caribensis]